MCAGLTVTLVTTKVPNFAVSDFATTGIYATSVSFILWNLKSPYFATPIGFLFGGIVAVGMYLTVLRPLIRRGASLVMLMIATLAVDLIFTGADLLFIEQTTKLYGRILGDKGYTLYSIYALGDFRLFGEQGMLFVGPITVVGVTISLYLLLNKTKFGVAMRASIENANLARTVGINVEKVYLISWFIAGGITGLAGGFYAITYLTQQGLALTLIVSIFAGSVLGGLGSIYGAIIGGFVIGIGQTYVTGSLILFVNSITHSSAGDQLDAFQLGIPLAIMIVTLLIAPKGLTAVRWRRIFGGKAKS